MNIIPFYKMSYLLTLLCALLECIGVSLKTSFVSTTHLLIKSFKVSVWRSYKKILNFLVPICDYSMRCSLKL